MSPMMQERQGVRSIALTKALVNQIAAEIYVRFLKQYPTADTCYGPEIFEILLLSAEYGKKWGLRRVVLDEAHTIGDSENGLAWARTLLLTPVPLIALSATIGNAVEFNKWLLAIQKSHSIPLHLVQYEHRYSHLRKYIYVPIKKEFCGFSKPVKGRDLDDLENSLFLHPYSALSSTVKTIQHDLALESSDQCSLLQAMQVAIRDTGTYSAYSNTIKSLIPSIYFKDTPYLTNAHVIKYEASLRKVLESWMQLPNSSKPESVLRELNDEMTKLCAMRQNFYSERKKVSLEDKTCLKDILLPFFGELNLVNELPDLMFNFERHGCEELFKSIVFSPTGAEDEYKRIMMSGNLNLHSGKFGRVLRLIAKNVVYEK